MKSSHMQKNLEVFISYRHMIRNIKKGLQTKIDITIRSFITNKNVLSFYKICKQEM